MNSPPQSPLASSQAQQVVVSGAFDNLRSREIRFLQEASRLGDVTVLLWSDDLVRQFAGPPPEFPESERSYLLQAIRYVCRVQVVSKQTSKDVLPEDLGFKPDLWAVQEPQDHAAKRDFCQRRGLRYRLLRDEDLRGFPVDSALGERGQDAQVDRRDACPTNLAGQGRAAAQKKVIVTGCYDWFHSGHVRFFEEVSAYGDLYVVVGHDANIRLLKGEGHPLFPQEERRYVVGAVRFVRQALVSTGEGWLDAEPEILRLKPDIYAVNEEGDRGGKREYCAQHGIEYLVLKRIPAPGLPKRSSTGLRGF